MNTIVTHTFPDLDAITSTWLLKKFYKGWKDAEVKFVSAGKTLDELPPDDNPEIIHVDTGFGKFDHHQTNAHTCASEKVYLFLTQEGAIPPEYIPAVARIVKYVVSVDHFEEAFYPEPWADHYDFLLPNIIDGLHMTIRNDEDVLPIVFKLLESCLQLFRNKVRAEFELKKGYIFETTMGKSIAMDTRNEEAVKLALKKGFQLVIRKDPNKGHVRIKTFPNMEYDLTTLYEALKKEEPQATWFLHASKHMLLNGSSKNPQAVSSQLPLKKVVEITKNVL